ncbi:hypothetical protein BO86DRAFT_392797 [Aspergillus japonicus CBS 114.51]|uniref:Uncharacterized protein n=2 Tax=Aspergillus subgen. Circumdati TaxID=2720871 RepID=A0A2V5I375_9EURO|nr:hypothetical protein BO86DRAFT_392797 [Aspergillus japonicus CBS 114.51]PYI31245.1 hypothetical protein BP00DRAFT_425715 [Aspergillus indologenus CBS 114.80]RAH77337.1 hypothetical protein BO86DRAFT_392797 [Aspergillus japonicus CBS 114.51]
MPHKVSDSTSSLSSSGSSGNGVVVTDMRGMSGSYLRCNPCPIVLINSRTNHKSPELGSHAGPRRTQAPVIIHNQGGQIYDETRPSDWDKQRWK